MALGTSQTITFSDLREYALTRDVVFADVVDHVFSYSPSVGMFFNESLGDQFGNIPMRGSANISQTGGIEIQSNVRLGKHEGSKAMAGPWDTHSVTPDDNNRRIKQNWKHYSGALVISETDRAINAGDAAMGDFVADQTEAVMLALADTLGDDLWASTTTANGITCLNDLIGAGSSSVQGLDGGDYENYNSRGLSARGTAAASVSFASGSFVAQGISDMRTCFNNASEGVIKPNVIFTDYTTHERYEGTLQPQERYAAPASNGDAGFTSLAFRTVPVLADPKAIANSIFMLRLGQRDLSMRVLSPFNFRFAPFKPGSNQESFVSELQWKGNTLLRNRRYGNNKMTSITD